MISIHVLREEDDDVPFTLGIRCIGISIHVLREEDDYPYWVSGESKAQFQSTSSARRTTFSARRSYVVPLFQSTSSARRTTGDRKVVFKKIVISIHVLREEDDSLAMFTKLV